MASQYVTVARRGLKRKVGCYDAEDEPDRDVRMQI